MIQNLEVVATMNSLKALKRTSQLGSSRMLTQKKVAMVVCFREGEGFKQWEYIPVKGTNKGRVRTKEMHSTLLEWETVSHRVSVDKELFCFTE